MLAFFLSSNERRYTGSISEQKFWTDCLSTSDESVFGNSSSIIKRNFLLICIVKRGIKFSLLTNAYKTNYFLGKFPYIF